VLEHIESVGGIKRACHRTGEHVVHEGLDRPVRVHPLLDVGDEDRIEIHSRDLGRRLLHDPRAERIGAANL